MGRATLAAAFSGKPRSKSAAWLLLLGPPSHGGGLGGSRTPRTAPRGSSPSPPSLPHHGGSRCPLLPAPHRAPTFALFLPPSPGEGGGGTAGSGVFPPHTHLLAQPWGGQPGQQCRGGCPALQGAGEGAVCPWQVPRHNVGQALIFSGTGGAAPGWRHSCLLRWNANCSLRERPPSPLPDPPGPRTPPARPEKWGACWRWGGGHSPGHWSQLRACWRCEIWWWPNPSPSMPPATWGDGKVLRGSQLGCAVALGRLPGAWATGRNAAAAAG